MIKAVLLLCVVGTSLCQLLGGWHDFHGQIPDAVTAAVKQTLEAENHIQLDNLSYTNVKQQVVAGFNYAFDVSFTGHGGKNMVCQFQVYQHLDGVAEITSHTC